MAKDAEKATAATANSGTARRYVLRCEVWAPRLADYVAIEVRETQGITGYVIAIGNVLQCHGSGEAIVFSKATQAIARVQNVAIDLMAGGDPRGSKR